MLGKFKFVPFPAMELNLSEESELSRQISPCECLKGFKPVRNRGLGRGKHFADVKGFRHTHRLFGEKKKEVLDTCRYQMSINVLNRRVDDQG